MSISIPYKIGVEKSADNYCINNYLLIGDTNASFICTHMVCEHPNHIVKMHNIQRRLRAFSDGDATQLFEIVFDTERKLKEANRVFGSYLRHKSVGHCSMLRNIREYAKQSVFIQTNYNCTHLYELREILLKYVEHQIENIGEGGVNT
jgi:hypothetical protein